MYTRNDLEFRIGTRNLQRLKKEIKFKPIAFAKMYDKIDGFQELGSMGSVYDLDWGYNGYTNGKEIYDRPVAMRGSRNFLIAKYSYSRPNIAIGWAERIAERYLRKIKYFCIDQKEHYANMLKIQNALRRKFYLTYHFDIKWPDDNVFGVDDEYCWIDGTRVKMSHEERRKIAQSNAKEMSTKDKKMTRRQKERIVLRAIMELGLIEEENLS